MKIEIETVPGLDEIIQLSLIGKGEGLQPNVVAGVFDLSKGTSIKVRPVRIGCVLEQIEEGNGDVQE